MYEMTIYQYSSKSGEGEYIILSDNYKFSIQENCKPDYQLDAQYSVTCHKSLSGLPFEYVLNRE